MKKTKTKRILSIVLCVMLVMSNIAYADTGNAEPTKYADITGNKYEVQIRQWIANGFIKGYPDGNFKPQNQITRSEFMALVNRAYGFTDTMEIKYSDVGKGNWYHKDAALATKAGFIQGANGQLMPLDNISRQEMAVILSRLTKSGKAADDAAINNLTDKKGIPAWSKAAISTALKNKFFDGFVDKTFNPTEKISRLEAVVALDRAYNSMYKGVYASKGTFGPEAGMETLDGSVVVIAPEVTLRNTTINGNLILRETIGEGNVYLDNVVVKGETIVKGGGANSIVVKNSTLGKITVIKEGNTVRIVATGSTAIDTVNVGANVKLEESVLTGTGFNDVVVFNATPKGTNVVIKGNFGDIQIDSPNINVTVESGTIGTLTLAAAAANTNLNFAKEAKVTTLTLNAAANVIGTGTIDTANINVSGTSIEQKPSTVNIPAGVQATIAGKPAIQTPPATPVTSGGGGGGGGYTPPAPVLVSAVTVTSAGNATTVVNGGTLQMSAAVTPTNATNQTIAWSVATLAGGTATIDAASGLLTATGAGTVRVTATNAVSGISGTKDITITAPVTAITVTSADNTTTVVNSGTLQMSAAVAPTNATNKAIVWSVSTLADGTATIDAATGLLTATGVGTVRVTATNLASGVSSTKDITITPPAPVLVSAITVTSEGNTSVVLKDETLQMSAAVTPTNAANQTIVWSVSTLADGTATIDAATGLLTATGIGTVRVTATNVASGVSGTKDITITAPEAPTGKLLLLSSNSVGAQFKLKVDNNSASTVTSPAILPSDGIHFTLYSTPPSGKVLRNYTVIGIDTFLMFFAGTYGRAEDEFEFDSSNMSSETPSIIFDYVNSPDFNYTTISSTPGAQGTKSVNITITAKDSGNLPINGMHPANVDLILKDDNNHDFVMSLGNQMNNPYGNLYGVKASNFDTDYTDNIISFTLAFTTDGMAFENKFANITDGSTINFDASVLRVVKTGLNATISSAPTGPELTLSSNPVGVQFKLQADSNPARNITSPVILPSDATHFTLYATRPSGKALKRYDMFGINSYSMSYAESWSSTDDRFGFNLSAVNLNNPLITLDYVNAPDFAYTTISSIPGAPGSKSANITIIVKDSADTPINDMDPYDVWLMLKDDENNDFVVDLGNYKDIPGYNYNGVTASNFDTDLTDNIISFTLTFTADGMIGENRFTTITDGSTVNFVASILGITKSGLSTTLSAAAPSSVATLTSTIGIVNDGTETIAAIPNGTTLADFKAAITPAAGATFEVYEADGTTVATDLASTYKVIVTAADTTTTKTYTVTVLAP